MAFAEINGGICGFITKVNIVSDGNICRIEIETNCPSIQKLVPHLTEVDPFREISHQGEKPRVLELAEKHCPHPGCPVPFGIIKTIEVECGLALPGDVTVKLSKTRENG